jgi:hypothetical protein
MSFDLGADKQQLVIVRPTEGLHRSIRAIEIRNMHPLPPIPEAHFPVAAYTRQQRICARGADVHRAAMATAQGLDCPARRTIDDPDCPVGTRGELDTAVA